MRMLKLVPPEIIEFRKFIRHVDNIDWLNKELEKYDNQIMVEHGFCVRFKGRYQTVTDDRKSQELKWKREAVWKRLVELI